MKIMLSGGLGNQMFQYALYFTFRNRGIELELDGSLYGLKKMHNGIELEKCFGIKDVIANFSWWNILIIRTIFKLNPRCVVYRDTLMYDDHVFKIKFGYLIGYWQSANYFNHIDSKLRDVFKFRNIDEGNQTIANRMMSCNSVSLHLRRSDYLGNALLGNVVTVEYYRKAIEYLLSNIKNSDSLVFFVFSDDKEFAMDFIEKLDFPMVLIDQNIEEESCYDMWLMSQCKHNIIANSSFSWWGAWLNRNSDKIVIAPRIWFNGPESIYKDIVPRQWIKI